MTAAVSDRDLGDEDDRDDRDRLRAMVEYIERTAAETLRTFPCLSG